MNAPHSIIIRPATPADAEQIVDFQLALAHESEGIALHRETVVRGVQAVFDVPTRGKFWVASHGDTLAACLFTVPEWSEWRAATVLWIHSVYVAESFRRQGIYRRMYERLRELVTTSSDYAGIRLYVDRRNIQAQRTYDALGMDGEHYTLYEWMK